MNDNNSASNGTGMPAEQSCRETVVRFSAAWARGDVDSLLSLMSDDPVYKGSTGDGPGTCYRGREAVRAAFARMVSPSAEAPPRAEMYFFANRALVFWQLDMVGPDGSKRKTDGVDVLTFTSDGRIAVKDAYRKAFG